MISFRKKWSPKLKVEKKKIKPLNPCFSTMICELCKWLHNVQSFLEGKMCYFKFCYYYKKKKNHNNKNTRTTSSLSPQQAIFLRTKIYSLFRLHFSNWNYLISLYISIGLPSLGYHWVYGMLPDSGPFWFKV